MTNDDAASARGRQGHKIDHMDGMDGFACVHISGHAGWVIACSVSPDNTVVATASEDATVKIWDLASGQCRRTLRHTEWVRTCAFSPADPSLLVSVSEHETINLWMVGDQESDPDRPVATAPFAHDSIVETCVFLQGGRRLVTASWTAIKLWHLAADGRSLHLESTWSPHGSTRGFKCALSRDDRLLASPSEDHMCRIFDVRTNARVAVCAGHTSEVRGCDFSCDGSTLATGSTDRTVKLWDVSNIDAEPVACRATLDIGAEVMTCAFSPETFWLLAVAFLRGTVTLWDTRPRICLATFESPRGWFPFVTFSPDGSQLITSLGQESVRIIALPGELKVGLRASMLALLICGRRRGNPWLPRELWELVFRNYVSTARQ